ncbi:polysaccharide biosynthesis/export family protein [Aeromonas veronii]|uniref:polysaccharide biosynthesis/export family protein n=1 Tax=Aeromonas veronii TaxID=654 RepID=UPI003B9E62B1
MIPQAHGLEVAQEAAPVRKVVSDTQTRDPVFGNWLFRGEFARESFNGFNPDYRIAIGDKLQVQLWGGVEFEQSLLVDHQGNIFLPKVGPVKVAGVRNEQLNDTLLGAITRVYQKNVSVYATLDVRQPVKIFVTGFVNQPGLYAGQSGDSILYFLDKAGGISPERGSYLDVALKRGGKTLRNFNLYQFLLNGNLQPTQLRDGDTLVVAPLRYQSTVRGKVANANKFEMATPHMTLAELLQLARPDADATHIRVSRNQGEDIRMDNYSLSDTATLARVMVSSGDTVEAIADKRYASIAVRIEGEHDSEQEVVLRYGARLGELLNGLKLTRDADINAIQLYRDSVKVRQKEMLGSSLKAFEASILTARSASDGEASLRKSEADLLMQWVARAKEIEPSGQVVLANAPNLEEVRLEPGDIIRIPRQTNLVMVHGDVMFPNAILADQKRTVADYINLAGGFTQKASNSRILLLHRDGTFSQIEKSELEDRDIRVTPGDEIFVLPQVETKSLQITKDFTSVLYQIAVSAGVLVAL